MLNCISVWKGAALKDLNLVVSSGSSAVISTAANAL